MRRSLLSLCSSNSARNWSKTWGRLLEAISVRSQITCGDVDFCCNGGLPLQFQLQHPSYHPSRLSTSSSGIQPMAFAQKPGCPMCSIVSTALHAPSNSPRSPSFPVGSTQPEVLWRDDDFTAYKEKANPVSSKGHIVIAFKSVVTLSEPGDSP